MDAIRVLYVECLKVFSANVGKIRQLLHVLFLKADRRTFGQYKIAVDAMRNSKMSTKKLIGWIGRASVLPFVAVAIVAMQLNPAQADDYGTNHGYRNNVISVQIASGYSNYGRNTGTYLRVAPGIGYGYAGHNHGFAARYPVPSHNAPSDNCYRPGYNNGRCH